MSPDLGGQCGGSSQNDVKMNTTLSQTPARKVDNLYDMATEVVKRSLTDYLPVLRIVLADRNLKLSEPNSTAKIFTP